MRSTSPMREKKGSRLPSSATGSPCSKLMTSSIGSVAVGVVSS